MSRACGELACTTTKAEGDATNWAKVLTYARAGITTDFAVTGDFNTWWADFLTYADYGPWISTDMRIIKKLDPTQPDVLRTDR